MMMNKYAAYFAVQKKHPKAVGHETPSYDSNGNYDLVITFVEDGKMVAVYTGSHLYEV